MNIASGYKLFYFKYSVSYLQYLGSSSISSSDELTAESSTSCFNTPSKSIKATHDVITALDVSPVDFVTKCNKRKRLS